MRRYHRDPGHTWIYIFRNLVCMVDDMISVLLGIIFSVILIFAYYAFRFYILDDFWGAVMFDMIVVAGLFGALIIVVSL